MDPPLEAWVLQQQLAISVGNITTHKGFVGPNAVVEVQGGRFYGTENLAPALDSFSERVRSSPNASALWNGPASELVEMLAKHDAVFTQDHVHYIMFLRHAHGEHGSKIQEWEQSEGNAEQRNELKKRWILQYLTVVDALYRILRQHQENCSTP